MEIPAKIKIPLCIERGSVFNFFVDFGDAKRESKNRYCVVVNREPKTDHVLIMVTSTKQIEKRYEFVKRAGIDSITLVRVEPRHYQPFTRESVFDCNDVIEISLYDLVEKIEKNGSMNYPKFPAELVQKIIFGIKASPRVSEEVKKLL